MVELRDEVEREVADGQLGLSAFCRLFSWVADGQRTWGKSDTVLLDAMRKTQMQAVHDAVENWLIPALECRVRGVKKLDVVRVAVTGDSWMHAHDRGV